MGAKSLSDEVKSQDGFPDHYKSERLKSPTVWSSASLSLPAVAVLLSRAVASPSCGHPAAIQTIERQSPGIPLSAPVAASVSS